VRKLIEFAPGEMEALGEDDFVDIDERGRT
jgi:hypothetical protein